MYHPDTLSAMAKQKRLQIHYEQNQLRPAIDDTLATQPKINITKRLVGIIQTLVAQSQQITTAIIRQ
jgi:hypothetical protein